MIHHDPITGQFEIWAYDPNDQQPPKLLAACPTKAATEAALRLLFPKEHDNGKARES